MPVVYNAVDVYIEPVGRCVSPGAWEEPLRFGTEMPTYHGSGESTIISGTRFHGYSSIAWLTIINLQLDKTYWCILGGIDIIDRVRDLQSLYLTIIQHNYKFRESLNDDVTIYISAITMEALIFILSKVVHR